MATNDPAVTANSKVTVRNTFLDIDDEIVDYPLERAQTVPGGFRPSERSGAQSEVIETDEEIEEDEDDHVEAEKQQDRQNDQLNQPHSSLCRITTRDVLEDGGLWTWTNSSYAPSSMMTSALHQPGGSDLASVSMPGCASAYMQQPVATPGEMMVMQGGAVMMPTTMPGGCFPVAMPTMMGAGGPMVPMQPMPMQQIQAMPMQPMPMQPMPMPGGMIDMSGMHASMGNHMNGLSAAGSVPQPNERASLPRASALERTFSVGSMCHRIRWGVPASKLKGTDKQHVSPVFEIDLPDNSKANFKLLMYPKKVSDGKGGASFKKAKGQGYVQLKCETDLLHVRDATLKWRMAVGTTIPWFGPVVNNFKEHTTCKLLTNAADEYIWNFNDAVDTEQTQAFTIVVEVSAAVQQLQ
jgi:hypothetical protein